jgi:CRP-like cAMP-binding protein
LIEGVRFGQIMPGAHQALLHLPVDPLNGGRAGRVLSAIECIEDGQVMTITYAKLLEIYFQNPQLGYYFLVLISQRLLENISRLRMT